MVEEFLRNSNLTLEKLPWIRIGEISLRKKVQASNFVKIKDPTMIQMNRIQLTSQTTNQVEINKILSTSQRKIIDS